MTRTHANAPAATHDSYPPRTPVGGKTAMELFGHGRTATTTRERLIEAALDLFYVYGFHAVGLDRILAAVGISKQAFYKHFASKDDLAVEVIRTRDRIESAAFIRRVEEFGKGNPRQMLLAVFDVLDEWFTHPDFNGCLFLTACFEFPSPHDPLHQAGGRHYAEGEQKLHVAAAAAGADDPAALARELTLLIEGAISYRVVSAADDAARVARRMAEHVLAARLPTTPAPVTA